MAMASSLPLLVRRPPKPTTPHIYPRKAGRLASPRSMPPPAATPPLPQPPQEEGDSSEQRIGFSWPGYFSKWAIDESLGMYAKNSPEGAFDEWKCQVGICGEANIQQPWVAV